MEKTISKKQLSEFGIIIGFFFPVFVGWIIPLISGDSFRFWTLYVALPFLSFGILKPRILTTPYKYWMIMGYLLGWINSRIILGLIFLLVVQPIAILMRLFKYDPLRKKLTNHKTYREGKKNLQIDLTRVF